MKKIIRWVLIIVVILVVSIFVWFRFVDVSEIEFLKNSDNSIADVACSYPMKISGDSMKPIYESGETVSFDKCFDQDDLEIGKVVVYKDESVLRVVVIRNIDGNKLEVSNEGRAEDVRTINFSDLVAISKE